MIDPEIQALKLRIRALELRPVSGYKELRGRPTVTVPANSRIDLDLTAGHFTAFGGITITSEWANLGGNFPLVIVPDHDLVTPTKVSLVFYQLGSNWFVGTCTFSFIAWGT